MFARQKAFSITRCIRTHPDDSRPGIHPLVLGLQPPSAPVVVDARRTDQLARIWVAAKEPPRGAILSSKLIPSGDL